MRLRKSIRTGFLAVLTLLVATAASAENGSAEVPFRFYTVLDGLTQSEVIDIDQDTAGYLWFTTARGLNRFDGKDFDQYTIADGLRHNSLTAIHVSDVNTVWAGDVNGGLTAIEGGRVVRTIEPLEDAKNPILDIEYFGARLLAVVEEFGVIEVSAEKASLEIRPLVDDESVGITAVAVFGEDVWVESTTGLHRLILGRETQLELIDESIRKIHVDSTGLLWAADASGAVGTWSNGVFDKYVNIDAESDIVGIVKDRNGLVWVATENELFSFDSNAQVAEYSLASVRQYKGIDEVTSLFVDAENSIWLASSSRLIRFLGDRFQHFRLRAATDLETVWSIGQDLRGRMWFGTDSELILRGTDESLIVVGRDRGIPSGEVRDVVVDNNGQLWVGITKRGLFRVDVDTLTAEHVSGTDDMEVLDVALADDGAVWFSTVESGVWRYQRTNGSLRRFSTPNNTSVYTLDIWQDGTVLYGADEVGLVWLEPDGDGDYSETIIEVDADISQRLYNHVRLIDAESAWIATEEGGLFLFQDGGFEDFGTGTPLADQTVYLVEPLENGTIVVGGEQGLYQFVPGEPEFAHYNPQMGFRGMETNVHSTFTDSEGFLWIGTVDGATQMDVTKPMPTRFEPTPTIVRVAAELDGRQIFDNEEIHPKEFGAHIEFAAISLLSPIGMQYSYKLIGEDAAWGNPTTNRAVSYPRIPPGSYEFIVRARHPGGQWSQRNASQRFIVLPYFWQQPWFVVGLIIAGLVLLRAYTVYRTRKIEWLNESLRAQVDERTLSIETARQKLEISNERLSTEIDAHAAVETRFRRAFENAPIGMGLLDASGVLFDANPALKNMFWPDADIIPEVLFSSTLCDADKELFTIQYERLIHSECYSLDEKLTCIGHDEDELNAVVNLSTVRAESGKFMYSVLQIQDVTESLKLTDQLEYQASYDELTGLLNRRAFETQLEKSWENRRTGGKQSFLMFMDLDQFKVVNDTSGHTAGDQLLQAVSEILEDSVRGNDIVGRLGGDEFGIILWECPTDVAKRIAEQIRERVEQFRFHWDAETYRIGVSIGGLPVDPSVGDTNELQQLADAACYAAKEAGRNRVHMIEGDKDSARVHRGQVRWVQRIREAMDKNRFAIYAQPIRPIVDKPGEAENLEILLRLRDPESRKLIPPGAFLPAVERYGLSVELDKWVVTCLLHTLYVHNAFQAERRKYWINLSGSSVSDKRFADFLKDAIARSPLPPGTVNFEITETAVIRSVSEAGDLMFALRKMGCQFALDDFGSGLSSYGYLKKLPLDFIKIDGSFIRNLIDDKTDRIFVKSIIDIAHTLNIKTIAEFVESPEILKIVGDLGADYAQGFGIGRPYVFAPRFSQSADSELTTSRAKAS